MITASGYFVEYSQEQKSFHIDTQDRCLSANLRGVLTGQPITFIPLGLFPDRDAAQKFWDAIRNKLPVGETVHEESANG